MTAGAQKSEGEGGEEVLLIEESRPDPRDAAKYESVKGGLSEVLAQAYHNLGVIAVQQGRAAEGVERFAAAAEWKPDLAGLDRNWGIVSFRAAQYEKAVAPLSRHLQARPDDALARRDARREPLPDGKFSSGRGSAPPARRGDHKRPGVGLRLRRLARPARG